MSTFKSKSTIVRAEMHSNENTGTIQKLVNRFALQINLQIDWFLYDTSYYRKAFPNRSLLIFADNSRSKKQKSKNRTKLKLEASLYLLSIAIMLGCFLYFKIAFRVGSLIFRILSIRIQKSRNVIVLSNIREAIVQNLGSLHICL